MNGGAISSFRFRSHLNQTVESSEPLSKLAPVPDAVLRRNRRFSNMEERTMSFSQATFSFRMRIFCLLAILNVRSRRIPADDFPFV